jgi:hypothetical protein
MLIWWLCDILFGSVSLKRLIILCVFCKLEEKNEKTGSNINIGKPEIDLMFLIRIVYDVLVEIQCYRQSLDESGWNINIAILCKYLKGG